MSQIERIYKIHSLLQAGRAPSMGRLVEMFEASRATVRRDLDYMRDRLGAPLYFDRLLNGYRYRRDGNEPAFELPGVWFTPEELHALFLLDDLMTQLQTTVLAEVLKPIRKRLQQLMKELPGEGSHLRGRVKLMQTGMRPVAQECFGTVSEALARRRQLEMVYLSRARNDKRARVVCPQRLLHYRGAWYLLAWCHWRKDLREFALDAIESAKMTGRKAMDVDAATLEEFMGQGFGIFSGKRKGVARLRFKPEVVPWIAHEVWHPKQSSVVEADGSLLREVPYAHEKELVMEILRHGPMVEVVEPAELRERVQELLSRAVELYVGRPLRKLPEIFLSMTSTSPREGR